MNGFVTFQDLEGEHVVVNARRITSVRRDQNRLGHTVILFEKDRGVIVEGSLDEVMTKIHAAL